MFIITDKENNVIIDTGNAIVYWENGYPVIVEKDTAFVKEDVNVFEINELPEDFKFRKYCYTEEKSFYLNPDFSEPDPNNVYGISDELYNQIKSDYREQLASEVTKNGYNS